MTATLVLPGLLRDLAGGRSRLPVTASTVGEMLDALAVSEPLLERRIRDERGSVRPHLLLYVGDTDVRHLSGLATPVPDGADVYVLTAVSGG